MAILDIFKKKKEELQPIEDVPMPGSFEAQPAGAPQPSDVPLSQVMSMQRQGLTNNQIIQTLQRQGYQPTQIYDALARSEAKKSIEPAAEETEMNEMPREPRTAKHPETEAVTEQIIEEKWHELQKDVGKMREWREEINSRMDKLEQQSQDLKGDLEGLHKAIVARIGEYDKTLVDVGTEIKAMEKVFQKVLPELTTNVQELSRMTRTAKESENMKPESESLSAKLAKTKSLKK